ncbi:hypothetical protein [Limnohabitans sp. 15K]|uniref:hypothetical protein n=1 Tax=Limnohabitans sp. 15K TaxID=1100706 RepID=UPI000C1F24FF|nr:hypothetical protein [Limnohabitans sp. 15K]PIT82260.1 hypothetical protein B9Z40_00500 [Limnohabitans sp. 15K]
MKHFALATLTFLFTLTSTLLSAQSLVGEPEFIREQRDAIAQDRQVVMSAYERAAKACWQQFAVNACLSEARKARRTALEPLRQQDLVLNTQERLWRTEQRDQRLQGKQPDEPSQP